MRIVILTQVYVPDPASVGQHMHDFAAFMVARGHEVVVYCSSRGYDNPKDRYPRTEVRDGVRIRRYSLPIFRKTNLALRVFGSAWAQASLFIDALITPSTDLIFFSTSPPLIGVTATVVAKLKTLAGFGRRLPRAYWAMDLNPDQLIAMGKLTPGSATHRVLESANRFILRNSDVAIALDRFMAAKLQTEGREPQRLVVIPPWPHERVETPVPHEENWFRDRHGLQGKFVIMYSGNHSEANPLDTLLEAALAFRDDDTIRFAFIGGGNGKKAVEDHIREHKLTNCLTLPYQPLSDLRYSLGAADVHVVSLGPGMVGIIHPCKAYGSMAAGRPILFLGPSPSHLSDLVSQHHIGWQVSHGDVQGCIATLERIRATAPARLSAMGERGQGALSSLLSKEELCERLAEAVEALV